MIPSQIMSSLIRQAGPAGSEALLSLEHGCQPPAEPPTVGLVSPIRCHEVAPVVAAEAAALEGVALGVPDGALGLEEVGLARTELCFTSEM